MTTLRNFASEPEVHVDYDRNRVAMDVNGGDRRFRIARVEPVNVEECDAALLWAERMEAALDNFVSAVRLVQQGMERARSVRGGSTQGELMAVAASSGELPDDDPSWGAGGRRVYEEG